MERNRISSNKLQTAVILSAAVSICVIGVVHRVGLYAPLEPFSDQVFFIQWIKRLHLAEHVLPQGQVGQSWMAALAADEESLLNIYIRQVYAAQQHIFTSVSVGWFFLWTGLVGTTIDAQVVVSIATHGLAMIVLALTPVLVTATTPRGAPSRFEAVLSVLIAGMLVYNGFLSDFSATGTHNGGILFLFMALVATARWISSGMFRATAGITVVTFVLQGAAVYSFYTNVFLLPSATVLAILADGRWPRPTRLLSCMYYVGIMAVVFAPAIGLMLAERFDMLGIPVAASFFDVGREVVVSWPVLIEGMRDRVMHWAAFHTSVLGGGALVLGIIGLAAVWKFTRAPLFFFVLIAHFAASALLSGFTYFQKTAGYIVPLLVMGTVFAAGLTVKVLFEQLRERAWSDAIAVTASGSALVLILGLATSTWSAFDTYPRDRTMIGFVTRGDAVRNLIRQIDSHLMPGDILVPFRDYLAQYYTAFSSRTNRDVTVFRALHTLRSQLDRGQLRDYAAQRQLAITDRRSLLVVLAPEEREPIHQADITRVFGQQGFGLPAPLQLVHVDTLASTGLKQQAGPVLELYRVR